VTATDTGAGKTIVAATIAAGLLAQGLAVHVRKPVVTGVAPGAPGAPSVPQENADLAGLPDHELLAAVSDERAQDVAWATYEPAVSPHLAAELAGAPLDVAAIVAALNEAAGEAEAFVVEGIGGLLVPLTQDWDVRRLAAALAWPIVIVARPGLGTINHTLLSIEAARSGGLDVRAVVLTPWPAAAGTLERSNRATIERLAGVEVATLAEIRPLTRAGFAAAARTLPYERWLG
jgi:dethiobiotin synthetase